MQRFPLLNAKRIQVFFHLLPTCGLFCGLAVFGALLGRALFSSVYANGFAALLSALPSMRFPGEGGARALAYSLPPPMAYCGLMYVSGFSRGLLPLWMLTVTAQGTGWGMQLGAAKCLMDAGHGPTAWLALLLPMLALAPLYGYVALTSYSRAKAQNAPLSKSERLSPLARAVAACVALTALTTLQTTLTCLYGLEPLLGHPG